MAGLVHVDERVIDRSLRLVAIHTAAGAGPIELTFLGRLMTRFTVEVLRAHVIRVPRTKAIHTPTCLNVGGRSRRRHGIPQLECVLNGPG